MNNKQKKPREIQEIIGELSKSTLYKHKFHYVFVEGVDDVKIYAEIARKKDLSTKLSFEQQGGRAQLLKLHETVSSNPMLLNKVIFFADKDTFVFNSIPSDYGGIEFTKGYSIENDLFEDGYDFLMSELSSEEKIRFERLINNVSEWYAFEIEQVLSGKSEASKIAISGLNPEILASKSEQLEAAFLSKRSYTKADDTLCQQIKEGFKLLLRGKILFELLLRISFDRDYNSIHHREVTSIWNMSIVEGLRTEESNCRRIVSVFEKRMNQK